MIGLTVSDIQLPEQANTIAKDDNDYTKARVWDRILGAAMALPGAKVDRDRFLTAQLQTYYDEQVVQQTIDDRSATAGVDPDLIDRLADASIRFHVIRASGISFAAGLPGGWWAAGTIPADLVAFYREAVILAQKLAYLYGWPDLLDKGEVDQHTKEIMTLLIGSMLGAQAANRAITEISTRFAKQVATRLPRKALTQYAVYNVSKQVAKWIGIKVTKSTFARAISKVIPFVGGIFSAGVMASMMRPMARKLKSHLKTTMYALPAEAG